MSLHVVITARAEREVRQTHEWWAENRSQRQADLWYAGLMKALAELAETAHRWPPSREDGSFPYPIRDLLFGLRRRRPTHRAVYTIRDNAVVVLAVRYLAQEDLDPADFQTE